MIIIRWLNILSCMSYSYWNDSWHTKGLSTAWNAETKNAEIRKRLDN